jgi:hypothetical protein
MKGNAGIFRGPSLVLSSAVTAIHIEMEKKLKPRWNGAPATAGTIRSIVDVLIAIHISNW